MPRMSTPDCSNPTRHCKIASLLNHRRASLASPDCLPMQKLYHKLSGLLGGPTASGSILLWLLRGVFGAIIIGAAWVAFSYYNERNDAETGALAFAGILI